MLSAVNPFQRHKHISYITLSLYELSVLPEATPINKSLYILDKFFYTNPHKKMAKFCSSSTISRFYAWKDSLDIKEYSTEVQIKRSDLFEIVHEITSQNIDLSDLFIFCMLRVAETSQGSRFLSKTPKLNAIEKKKVLKKKIDCSIIKKLTGSSNIKYSQIHKLETFLPVSICIQTPTSKIVHKTVVSEIKEKVSPVCVEAPTIELAKSAQNIKKTQEVSLSMSEVSALKETTPLNRALYILDKFFVNNSRKRMKNFCSKNTLTAYFSWKNNLKIDSNSEKIQIQRYSLKEILGQIRRKEKDTVSTKDLYPFYMLAASKDNKNATIFSKKVPKKAKDPIFDRIKYKAIKTVSGIFKIKRNKINTLVNYLP
jgi:hypothetical protein